MMVKNLETGEISRAEVGGTQPPKKPELFTALCGHVNAETAFVQDDYPYGRTLRCKRRAWIETATKGQKKGEMRLVTQTSDPKRGNTVWNKPDPGTYHDFMVMYLNDDEHLKIDTLSAAFCEVDKFNEFCDRWYEDLDDENRKKLDQIGLLIAYREMRSKYSIMSMTTSAFDGSGNRGAKIEYSRHGKPLAASEALPNAYIQVDKEWHYEAGKLDERWLVAIVGSGDVDDLPVRSAQHTHEKIGVTYDLIEITPEVEAKARSLAKDQAGDEVAIEPSEPVNVTADDDPELAVNPKVVDRLVADGTMTQLTGLVQHDNLWRVAKLWLEYAAEYPDTYKTWEESWSQFLNSAWYEPPFEEGQRVKWRHLGGFEATGLILAIEDSDFDGHNLSVVPVPAFQNGQPMLPAIDQETVEVHSSAVIPTGYFEFPSEVEQPSLLDQQVEPKQQPAQPAEKWFVDLGMAINQRLRYRRFWQEPSKIKEFRQEVSDTIADNKDLSGAHADAIANAIFDRLRGQILAADSDALLIYGDELRSIIDETPEPEIEEDTPELQVFFTTAPEDYDGFGTKTLEWLPYAKSCTPDRKPVGQYRKVAVVPIHADWQLNRYGSGLHPAFDQERFDKLLETNILIPIAIPAPKPEEDKTVPVNLPEPIEVEEFEGDFEDEEWAPIGYEDDEAADEDEAVEVNPLLPSFVGTLSLAADSAINLRSLDVDRVMQVAYSEGYSEEFREWLLAQDLKPDTQRAIAAWQPELELEEEVKPIPQPVAKPQAQPKAEQPKSEPTAQDKHLVDEINALLVGLRHIPQAVRSECVIATFRTGIVGCLTKHNAAPKKLREAIANDILSEDDADVLGIIDRHTKPPEPEKILALNYPAVKHHEGDLIRFLQALASGETEFGGGDNVPTHTIAQTAQVMLDSLTHLTVKGGSKGAKRASAPRAPREPGAKRSSGGSSKKDQLVQFLKEEPRTIDDLCEFSGTAESAIKASLRAHLPNAGYVISARCTDGEMYPWWPTEQRPLNVSIAAEPEFQIIEE